MYGVKTLREACLAREIMHSQMPMVIVIVKYSHQLCLALCNVFTRLCCDPGEVGTYFETLHAISDQPNNTEAAASGDCREAAKSPLIILW